ncbi:hypothetical protein L6164_004139 [Bauhinia variegata]|uniref:Uncharacterized protein n=1 Tax=Bauhinia variegata TaxID=167791 RepID=A0ACB9Q3F5_BAUVA|nr:hypothetical protein L6164_004139 [Bauhinia variegata]
MDSINSFKGYGKVDELEQQAFHKKTRKRIIILLVSSIILVAVIVAAVAGVLIHKRNSSSSSDNSVPSSGLTPASSLKAVCDVTLYPDSCYSSISSLPNSNTTDPELLFKLSLRVAVNELAKLSQYTSKINAQEPRLQEAIDVCATVLDDALDRLNESISSLEIGGGGEKLLSTAKISDLRTWLTATITDQETCLDALEELNSTAGNKTLLDVRTAMANSTQFASNSLAIATKILVLLGEIGIPIHRRLLGFGGSESGFPDWVGPDERRLLQENTTTADLVVAQDGSGKFKTIREALATVPKKSKTRHVIYVKEGVYSEKIDLDKNTWNVMIYGDGKDKTVVTGSLNFVDGTPTFATATFAVKGKGFIARDIAFKNTAGPAKHQAVAFRSGSDMSVFYRCLFDGFQDTLYAHSNRQFYRDCDITGTVDFIFGNAAVVFQNCNIMPRQPLPNQFNTITAQGKKDPNQNSAISIQKCKFSAFDKLTAPTYLGRPWKEFSTTVIMQSDIGSFLNPLGWISWIPNVEPANTILYGEYQNSGPGSGLEKRVKWAGYKPTLTDVEAGKFTVESLIQGSEWLPLADSSMRYDSKL